MPGVAGPLTLRQRLILSIVALVVLLTVAFLVGLVWLTGVQVTAQFAQLQQTLITQATRTVSWATAKGIMPKQVDINGMMQQVLGSFGQLTSYLGIAFGALVFAFLSEQGNLLNILVGVSPDIIAVTQGVIVMAVVIAYEVVRRYRVRLEQASVGAELEASRPRSGEKEPA